MKSLTPPDSHHLAAAQGWLELGNHLEADAELDKIAPLLRVHPDVLEIRFEIYAKEKRWEAGVDIALATMKADPDRVHGWLRSTGGGSIAVRRCYPCGCLSTCSKAHLTPQ